MNLQTIANALATTIGTVNATNGSETESLTATADLPDQVNTKALLVLPPETANLDLIMGPRLDDHYLFRVVVLRDPMSVSARVKWLYAWATALRTKVQQNVDLDVAGVVEAQATAMRIELDGETYASLYGRPQDVVELMVDVHVLENTTAAI
jgi:hypothetical protein